MNRVRLVSQTLNQHGSYVAVLIHETDHHVLYGWLCSGCKTGDDVPVDTPADVAEETATLGRDAHAATCHAPPHD